MNFVCGPRIYEFKGWKFEFGGYSWAWPLKKDGGLRAKASKVFWKVFEEFAALPGEEQEKYRIGGGCRQF